MKHTTQFLWVVLCLLLISCSDNGISFETDTFKMSLNSTGNVTSLLNKKENKEYAVKEEIAPLLAIRVDGEYETPSALVWDENTRLLTLTYAKSNSVIEVEAITKDGYITFEIKKTESPVFIELVVWGPYATTITKTVGECVGVVRDDAFALGIRGLNPKTIGGYPTTEDDVDPSFDIFATNSLVDVDDSTKVLYRGQAAKHTDFGSVLQAYCRDRSKERVIPMWNHDKYVAPAYNDGGIAGSKIAFFGCPEPESLDFLEKIVLGEGLPHPTIKGAWGKRTPDAAAAYIIYPFNENNIEEAIAFTKRTGLEYLYHGGPFQTWGKFVLNPDEFPSGYAGLKNCVDKAAAQGVKLGLHTLSNFTTTNDPYVSPVPDKRLAKVGASTLSAAVNKKETALVVESPDYFNQMKNNNLHTVMVGDELIRYERVSEQAPWTLLNCERGAFNTKAAVHEAGAPIAKLLDHGYNVFLTDTDLTLEQARNIADIFNETGIMQVSFDGLEGAWSTGLGQYGLSLMTKEWYDNLKPEYRDCINDASMTTHYNWTMFTRMNWGEPWYAGFRESQMNYRLMNQDFYRRNLIPAMLGWFKYGADTSIEDVEWLLARTAAFDAGYTLVTDGKAVETNGLSDKIIQAIREWENARLSCAFPAELKQEMEHIDNEYHLQETSATTWDLYPLSVQRFKHQNIERQPGEPVVSNWKFTNPNARQPLQFILKATDVISNVSLSVGGFSTVTIPGSLNKGEYIKYEGGDAIQIVDKNWNQLRSVPIDSSRLTVEKGEAVLTFACSFASSDPEKIASSEIKTVGNLLKLNAARER